MQRMAMVIGLQAHKVAEYKALHAAPWPEKDAALHARTVTDRIQLWLCGDCRPVSSLPGRPRHGHPDHSVGRRHPLFRHGSLLRHRPVRTAPTPDLLQRVAAMQWISEDSGSSLLAAALQFPLTEPVEASVLLGNADPDSLKRNLAAAIERLSPKVYDATSQFSIGGSQTAAPQPDLSPRIQTPPQS